MAHLVDTSVLARLANTADPFHALAAQAVLELHRVGEVLHLTTPPSLGRILVEVSNDSNS